MSLMMNSTVSITHAYGGNLTVLSTTPDDAFPAINPTSAGLWTVYPDPSSFEQFCLVYDNDRNLALTLSPLPPPSGGKNYIQIILTPLEDPPKDRQLWRLHEGVEANSGNPPSMMGRLQSVAMKDGFAAAGNTLQESPEVREVVAEAKNPEALMQTWYFTYEGMGNF